MTGIPKRLRIAVVGERASGKSYLLYDLIHAFGLLGYQPEELPLGYPHSSFGTYFYDTFNSVTGGMRGTEHYACRPDNHYGAWLSKGTLGWRLEVDFLNIPGEVFDMGKDKDRMGMFFNLRKLIERRGKGLFFLSTWRNQAGLEKRLIVTKDLDLTNGKSSEASNQQRLGNYLNWDNLRFELQEGRYKEVNRKPVSGRYLFKHLTELQTDSLLLTIEQCWKNITSSQEMSLEDYKAKQVLFYFYPLVYCQQATDLIICDNLMVDSNVGELVERLAYFMTEGTARPNSYLAFRGADGILRNCSSVTKTSLVGTSTADAAARNLLYEGMVQEVVREIPDAGTASVLPQGWAYRIRQSLGDGVGQAFWHLLNATACKKTFSLCSVLGKRLNLYELTQQQGFRLPPHVYFSATPVDADGRIYDNDPADMTRFINDENGRIRSFTAEVNSGRVKHMCLGSYQLLTDILLQNGIHSEGLRQRGEHLRYIQSMI